jgi:tRNA pseudouridine55 synthase
MGIARAAECTPLLSESLVQHVLVSFRGEYLQAYPPYSAVRVGGKPLFWWARNNRLAEIEMPMRKRYISEIDFKCTGQIQKETLLELAAKRINLVEGDFRQKEIIGSWEAEFLKLNDTLVTVTFTCTCSSGTFIRGLVADLGKRLGCPATTLHLTRTAVGPYTVDDCEHLNY